MLIWYSLKLRHFGTKYTVTKTWLVGYLSSPDDHMGRGRLSNNKIQYCCFHCAIDPISEDSKPQLEGKGSPTPTPYRDPVPGTGQRFNVPSQRHFFLLRGYVLLSPSAGSFVRTLKHVAPSYEAQPQQTFWGGCGWKGAGHAWFRPVGFLLEV